MDATRMLDDTTALDSNPPAKKRRKAKAAPAPAKKKAAPKARPVPALAYMAFGVAGGLVLLSLAHLTEAIASLTGSHWALAALLAVGIDAGMAAAEALSLSAPEGSEASRWASRYVLATLAVSAALNAYAFALHASPGPAMAAAIGLGLFIPGAVFALLRAAGGAMLGK